jgi:hypothetical protein
MERAAKSAKAKVEARPPIARKSRKTDGSTGRQLEQRLTEALEQQAATSEILRVISSSLCSRYSTPFWRTRFGFAKRYGEVVSI